MKETIPKMQKIHFTNLHQDKWPLLIRPKQYKWLPHTLASWSLLDKNCKALIFFLYFRLKLPWKWYLVSLIDRESVGLMRPSRPMCLFITVWDPSSFSAMSKYIICLYVLNSRWALKASPFPYTFQKPIKVGLKLKVGINFRIVSLVIDTSESIQIFVPTLKKSFI